MLCAQAWKPSPQHAGEKRGVADLLLGCIQISQDAGKVVWYPHIFKNFPQFVVIHTVKGFGIVNKAEVDAFLEPSCFFDDPADVGNLISVSSVFFAFGRPRLLLKLVLVCSAL